MKVSVSVIFTVSDTDTRYFLHWPMPIPMPIPNLEFPPIPDTDTYAIFSQTPIPMPIPWKSTDTTDTDTDTDSIGASLVPTYAASNAFNDFLSMLINELNVEGYLYISYNSPDVHLENEYSCINDWWEHLQGFSGIIRLNQL